MHQDDSLVGSIVNDIVSMPGCSILDRIVTHLASESQLIAAAADESALPALLAKIPRQLLASDKGLPKADANRQYSSIVRDWARDEDAQPNLRLGALSALVDQEPDETLCEQYLRDLATVLARQSWVELDPELVREAIQRLAAFETVFQRFLDALAQGNRSEQAHWERAAELLGMYVYAKAIVASSPVVSHVARAAMLQSLAAMSGTFVGDPWTDESVESLLATIDRHRESETTGGRLATMEGALLCRMDRLADAELTLRTVVDADSQNELARLLLGHVLWRQQQYQAALDESQRVADVAAHGSWALRYVGHSLLCQCQYAEAIKMLKRLTEGQRNGFCWALLGFAESVPRAWKPVRISQTAG